MDGHEALCRENYIAAIEALIGDPCPLTLQRNIASSKMLRAHTRSLFHASRELPMPLILS